MKDFDPNWLIDAATKVEDEYPWLPGALRNCTKVVSTTAHYIYFVNPSHPNQPGSEWQFQESISLEGTKRGDVVLDLLKDQRVGGVELLSELLECVRTS